MKRITNSELLSLPFGSVVKIIWDNYYGNKEFFGVVFGDNIGLDDGSVLSTKIVALCMDNNNCICYLVN